MVVALAEGRTGESMDRLQSSWKRVLLVASAVGAVIGGAVVLAVGIGGVERLHWGEALVVSLGLFSAGLVTDRRYSRQSAHGQRLALVDDIVAEGDTRFGPEPVICRLLACLRDHYRAEVCVFVLTQQRRMPRLFCIEAGADQAVEFPSGDAAPLTDPLLAIPAGRGLIFEGEADGMLRRLPNRCRLYGETVQRASPEVRDKAAEIAGALDCTSFISVPLPREIRIGGRLFIGSRGKPFDDGDLDLLRPVIDQASMMLENACLLEMLAAEAAEHERQRLARDLHDSAVQPYIGLKFGLEALARKVRGNPELCDDVERLIERTASEITDMRQLIGGLHSGDGSGQPPLLGSLQRQTTRFGELFGISVEIGSEGELRVSRSLAREILHMVSEGLSNVCRHTRATKAMVWLRRRPESFELQIINDRGPGGVAPAPFTPCSLSERAAALGGTVTIDPGTQEGCTTVSVSIPLREQGVRS